MAEIELSVLQRQALGGRIESHEQLGRVTSAWEEERNDRGVEAKWRFTTADAYLFVMLRWARQFGVPMSAEITAYFERVAERPAVRQSLAEEGLTIPLTSSSTADAALVTPA